MKKIVILLFVILIGGLHLQLMAAAEEVTLTLPVEAISEVCAQPIWKGVKAVWRGVKDERQGEYLGVQKHKSNEPIYVKSKRGFVNDFGDALKSTFERCGVVFVKNTSEDLLQLSATVDKFYAESEKTLVTGLTKGTSAISIIQKRDGRTKKISLTCNIESKNMRSGKIKQLVKELNKLFSETIKLIPVEESLKQLI